MAALGWLMNLGFAASGVRVRYGAHIAGLSISQSGSADCMIDAAGYMDDGSIELSGYIGGRAIRASGNVTGGRIRKTGAIDDLKIQTGE